MSILFHKHCPAWTCITSSFWIYNNITYIYTYIYIHMFVCHEATLPKGFFPNKERQGSLDFHATGRRPGRWLWKRPGIHPEKVGVA